MSSGLLSLGHVFLSGYCLEGNVLHGGLDTADGAETDKPDGVVKPKYMKRKDKDSIVQYQRDMLHYMKERNVGGV